MNSRMEKVAQDVALAALRSASTASDLPLDYDALKEVFQARWPTKDSQRPMKDAMNASAQAASRCSGQDADSWKTAISRTWQTAVEEVVVEYFKAAEHSFEKGEASRRSGNPDRRREGNIGANRRSPRLAPR